MNKTIKQNQKNIYIYLRNLIKDLSTFPNVDFVQIFKIDYSNNNTISLHTLTNCIWNCFVSPCNPYIKSSAATVVLNIWKEEEANEVIRISKNGLEFLCSFSITPKKEYYFFFISNNFFWLL